MAAKIQAVLTVLYAGITPRRMGLEGGSGDEWETTLTVAQSARYLMLLSESLKKMRRAPDSDDEANWHRPHWRISQPIAGWLTSPSPAAVIVVEPLQAFLLAPPV